jgi:hypothetical protein
VGWGGRGGGGGWKLSLRRDECVNRRLAGVIQESQNKFFSVAWDKNAQFFLCEEGNSCFSYQIPRPPPQFSIKYMLRDCVTR